MESTRRDLAPTGFRMRPRRRSRRFATRAEANEIVIFGMDLKRGDEVVSTNQNYPRMITSWQAACNALAKRIVFKQDIVQGSAAVEDAYIRRAKFRQAITPRTERSSRSRTSRTHRPDHAGARHRANGSGRSRHLQVLRLTARTHSTPLSGVHARDDLECDYYGVSLHKWTLAPIGTVDSFALYARRRSRRSGR